MHKIKVIQFHMGKYDDEYSPALFIDFASPWQEVTTQEMQLIRDYTHVWQSNSLRQYMVVEELENEAANVVVDKILEKAAKYKLDQEKLQQKRLALNQTQKLKKAAKTLAKKQKEVETLKAELNIPDDMEPGST